MEKLFGKWRQTSHRARINDMLCQIVPADDVIWSFTEDGILAHSSPTSGTYRVSRVSYSPDIAVFHVRANTATRAVPYSVQFTGDDAVTLSAFNRNRDKITLVRL